MKTIIKWSSFVAIALALCTTFIFGCSLKSPDPLARFYRADEADLNKNKVITHDYKDYIQELSSDEKKYIGGTNFFKDDKGQQAVRIEVDLNGTAWYHALFYDKANKRTKVIKYVGYHYMS